MVFFAEKEGNETQNINGTSTMHQEQIPEEHENNGDSNPTPNRGIIVDERSDEQVSRPQHMLITATAFLIIS